MRRSFQEIYLRKSRFKIACINKNSMYDMIPFGKIIHMESHARDGKNWL